MKEVELFENGGYVGTVDWPADVLVEGSVYDGMLITSVKPATNGSDFNVVVSYVF